MNILPWCGIKWEDPSAERDNVTLICLLLMISGVHSLFMDFPCGSAGKKSTCNVGDPGSTPGLRITAGEGKSYPLQYSGLENFMDCIVHGITKSQTQLSNFHFTSLNYQFALSKCCCSVSSKTVMSWEVKWCHER